MAKKPSPNSSHLEAEQSVIGGLIIKNDALPDVSNVLSSDDFFDKRHQLLFKTIQSLASQGQSFDPVTLSEQLQKDGNLNAIGGGPYLGVLVKNALSDPNNIIAYVQMVKEHSQANSTQNQDDKFGPWVVERIESQIRQNTPRIATETVERKATNLHKTDLGNAERFVLWHGKNVKYCALTKCWHIWNGKQWEKDERKKIHSLAMDAVRCILVEASDTTLKDTEVKALVKHAFASESAQRIKAMLSLTECLVPVHLNDFDAKPMQFNTASGTLDLTNGQLLEHDPDTLHSKISNIKYNPQADCSRWLEFVDWTFKGDSDLINFVQKAVGYSLTGSIEEQCLFVLYGDGSNGKSTFVDTLSTLLGDYGAVAAPEILVKRRNDQHPTEIANLKGARFVAVNETEKGRSLDENRVKMITGEERITSRFMRGDFFTFKQEYTFWLSTNNKPNIKGTDKGIWRRIRLIPFENTIDDKTIDRRLVSKLKKEMPGILNWAIQGCLKWQKEGLDAPIAVAQATEEYRVEQDALGRFIDECCELNANVRTKTSELFNAYKTWCDENGERAEKTREFGKTLKKRGFEPYKGAKGVRYWLGIVLIQNVGGIENGTGGVENSTGGIEKKHEIINKDNNLTDKSYPTGGMGGMNSVKTSREGISQGAYRFSMPPMPPNSIEGSNDVALEGGTNKMGGMMGGMSPSTGQDKTETSGKPLNGEFVPLEKFLTVKRHRDLGIDEFLKEKATIQGTLDDHYYLKFVTAFKNEYKRSAGRIVHKVADEMGKGYPFSQTMADILSSKEIQKEIRYGWTKIKTRLSGKYNDDELEATRLELIEAGFVAYNAQKHTLKLL